MKLKKFNCAPTLKKDIKIPTRKELLPIINELRQQIVNTIFTVEEIVEIVGIFIGKRFKVDVKHACAAEVPQNDIDLNAYYDSGLDEVNHVSIEIFLITNPMDTVITLDNEGFDAMAKRIADSISHEMVHMKQSRARGFLEVDTMADQKVDDELLESQLYLGDYNEVDAYAHNIAAELLDLPDYRAKLSTPSTIATTESVNLWAYMQTFSKDFSHPVLKRLLKKIYKHLNQN